MEKVPAKLGNESGKGGWHLAGRLACAACRSCHSPWLAVQLVRRQPMP